MSSASFIVRIVALRIRQEGYEGIEGYEGA